MRTYRVLAVAALVLAGCGAASSGSAIPMGHASTQGIQIQPAQAPAFAIQPAPSSTKSSTVIGHAVSNGTTSPQPPGSSFPSQPSTNSPLAPGPACTPGTHLGLACTAP